MITEDAILNFISTRVSELVLVLPCLLWSHLSSCPGSGSVSVSVSGSGSGFRIPDSGFSIRPISRTDGKLED